MDVSDICLAQRTAESKMYRHGFNMNWPKSHVSLYISLSWEKSGTAEARSASAVADDGSFGASGADRFLAFSAISVE